MPARNPPPSPRPRSSRGGGWIWQAALVFGPLLVLAGLGVWGIRESRVAAKRHAIQELEATIPLVEKMARAANDRLREAQVPFHWINESLPSPVTPGEGAALYERALSVSPAEAVRLLNEIERHHQDESTASGLPLLPLVKWARLQAAPGPELQRAAEDLAVAAVRTHPSVLSAELLARVESYLSEKGEDTSGIMKWRAIRAEHERAKAIFEATPHRDKWEGGWVHPAEAAAKEPGWFFWAMAGDDLRACPPERLRAAADALSAQAQAILPTYVALDVTETAGASVLSFPPQGERFFERPAGNGPLAVAWVLTDPAGLFAEQRRQAQWLGALLAAALLAAATGFFVLRRSLARERQLSEMKSNFVSSVSHELRAPLASMRLMAENLEAGVVRDEPRRGEYHRLMADECRRLGALVDNVLDFARIEQGRKTYHFAETDIAALVADTLRLLTPAAERREQKFVCEVEPITPRCDGLAVQQALVNLLDNALKFSPAQSAVAVRVAARNETEWTLSVRDEGVGVPLAEKERIFERFYRVGSELTRETQGAGIGLSIVKHIAEGHGGRVEVEGATFTLVLPMEPGAGETPHTQRSTSNAQSHAAPVNGERGAHD